MFIKIEDGVATYTPLVVISICENFSMTAQELTLYANDTKQYLENRGGYAATR